ncbi:hypothetical protein [Xanthomonas oryzae]|uniref:hypothetical protein n=1 Tax=Xanthomonas oryzae TaxID=347 RepID=UPI003CFC4CFD
MTFDTYERVDLTGPWAGFDFQGHRFFTPENYDIEPLRHAVLGADLRHRTGVVAADVRRTQYALGDPANAYCHQVSGVAFVSRRRNDLPAGRTRGLAGDSCKNSQKWVHSLSAQKFFTTLLPILHAGPGSPSCLRLTLVVEGLPGSPEVVYCHAAWEAM